MALDITGIHNVGEFYSQHYLDALLERDLNPTLKRWAEADKAKETKAPYKALAGLANGYFQNAHRAYGSADPSERLEQARAFHARLLGALGFTRQPGLEPVGEDVVPVLVSEKQNGKPFDLALLDVQMPGLNGLQLQERLMTSGSNLPIIFISAYEDGDVRARAVSLGAAGFLEKPFNDEDLLDAISSAIADAG